MHCQADNEWPAELTISLLQGKWKLRILTQLKHGPIRLSQLRKMFPGASKKMLTQHLREMEHDGIVVRSDLSNRRRHVEYSLEKPLGVAVLHLINTLTEWDRNMHRLGQGNHQQVRICPKSRVAPRKGRLAHQAPWCRPAESMPPAIRCPG